MVMAEAAGLRLPGDSSGGTAAPSNNQEGGAAPSGAHSDFMARQPVPLQNAAQVSGRVAAAVTVSAACVKAEIHTHGMSAMAALSCTAVVTMCN